MFHLSIESHFVGIHGPYELHRKEEHIRCTALVVYENLLFFPMQFIWPVNTDKMKCDSILIFTSFYNKVCRDIAYFNTICRISQISNVQKVKHLEQPEETDDELNKAAMGSSANNTNKILIFLKFDNRKYNNILLLYKSICHLLLKWT